MNNYLIRTSWRWQFVWFLVAVQLAFSAVRLASGGMTESVSAQALLNEALQFGWNVLFGFAVFWVLAELWQRIAGAPDNIPKLFDLGEPRPALRRIGLAALFLSTATSWVALIVVPESIRPSLFILACVLSFWTVARSFESKLPAFPPRLFNLIAAVCKFFVLMLLAYIVFYSGVIFDRPLHGSIFAIIAFAVVFAAARGLRRSVETPGG